MTQVTLHKTIVSNIAKVGKNEKITRDLLAILSRDCLEYIGVNSSPDIATVNRLIAVLTPMNAAMATKFFNHFLPFKLDKESGVFGGMIKGDKALEVYHAKVIEFMFDDDNNIWTWADVNLDPPELKAKDFQGKVTNLVKRALSDKTEAITSTDVLSAVLAGGISLADLWDTIDNIQSNREGHRDVTVARQTLNDLVTAPVHADA